MGALWIGSRSRTPTAVGDILQSGYPANLPQLDAADAEQRKERVAARIASQTSVHQEQRNLRAEQLLADISHNHTDEEEQHF